MKRDHFRHGFSETNWEKAKAEAKQAMISRARIPKTISYSELVSAIRAISLEPHDPRLSHFLGEIAAEEDAAGRGMLTVVVVHKHGDQKPGPGFYEMARGLGRETSDQEAFWVSELDFVHRAWSKRVAK
ncbi:hypothetical protein EJ066_08120 [Mesorhizobium sp. M9A.F.Ca.ET.002.03.1.2]|uniref:hypothetical protein n=1 Tax=Mesorhizobium sp. M9A.F.Ca.ET.002.03.1.2 TaxID=2493668 RepID=UPI000F75A0BA|nr:hypothetical protein [Mesorhizobium sp. M9A.F.Ca.ET.002.03.1.2]AZN97257.1 hypothetical protein EJ066_08120 [Mesorhizobium sp. M9A.F.Ca.ET.002.03.1.2]